MQKIFGHINSRHVMGDHLYDEIVGEAVSQFRSPHAPDHFLQNLVEPHQVAFGILLEFTDMGHGQWISFLLIRCFVRGSIVNDIRISLKALQKPAYMVFGKNRERISMSVAICLPLMGTKRESELPCFKICNRRRICEAVWHMAGLK